MRAKFTHAKMTHYINFLGAPGAGKSLMCALTYVELKKKHMSVEIVSEYAKQLVYMKDYEMLNNQWIVSYNQYKMLKSMENVVDFVCCDSPLLLGLFYNEYHSQNVCDVSKTKEMILSKITELEKDNNSSYIFIERNTNLPFEKHGRIHGEQEANIIEVKMKEMFDTLGVKYMSVKSDVNNIDDITNHINDT